MMDLVPRIAVLVLVALIASGSSVSAEEKISIDLQDMSVRDALAAILDEAGVSYVLKEGITGRIERLSFKNVKLETALDAVMQTSDLVSEVDDGIYMISPREAQRKAQPVAVSPGEAEEYASEQPQLEVVEQPETQLQQTEEWAMQDMLPESEFYVPVAPYYPPYEYFFPPFQYGGVIHNPPLGPLNMAPIVPYRLIQPPRLSGFWRNVPRINGIPIY